MTTKIPSLKELYLQVLATVKMVATEDGFISIARSPKQINPVTVAGKRWVLPVPEQMSNASDPTWEQRVAFHPLYENLARGESDVLAEYRKNANHHLNCIAGLVAYQLLELATSPAEHGKLNPDQSEFLSVVKDADVKTLEKFRELLEKMDGDKCMLNIFLRRGGMVGGRKHSRVGVVFFPLYEELAKADDKILGITLRKKHRDKETLMALLKYIFPKIDQAHAYDYGSDSLQAPTMDALMHAMYNVIAPINDVIAVFENIFPDAENLTINADWIETFDNLSAMRGEIYSVPQMAGNEGASAKVNIVQTASGTAVAVPAPAPAQAPAPAPAQLQAVSFPPVAPPPQQFGGFQAPLPAPTGPSSSGGGRGVDFNQLIATNPLLRGAPMQPQAGMGAVRGGQQGFTMMPMQQNNGWGAPMQQQQQQQMGTFNTGFNTGGFGGSGRI